MLKLVETAVFTSIEGKMEGTWAAGHSELGLAQGGVGISPMTYTETIKNGTFAINGTTKTRWEWIEDITAKIIAGDIVVSDVPEEAPAATPGFEGFTIIAVFILMGIAATSIRRRR